MGGSPENAWDILFFSGIMGSGQKVHDWAPGIPVRAVRAGQCGGSEPECVLDEDCNDGVECTIDSCVDGNCLNTPNDAFCSNNDVCDGIEYCDVNLGCQPGTPLDCDDGLYCTGVETCDTLAGCQDGADPDCTDTVACTDDSCNEGTDRCDNIPNDANCDDSNECTTDVCIAGSCQNTPVVEGTECDDGLFCNGDDTCNGGSCSEHDGTPCPETECNHCNESQDNCFDTAGTACTDDGNVCTDNQCDGAGTCTHPNNTAPCSDGLFCTLTDECQGGQCIGSGNRCAPPLVCNEAEDMCNCSQDEDCDDGLYCNGDETCEGSVCLPGIPVNCTDTVACTDDSCNEGTDRCDNIPNDANCDDSNECTTDVCIAGSCQNSPVADGTTCNDGLFCNGNDTCNGGSCSLHVGNPCPETECNHCNESQDNCFDPYGTLCTADSNICTNGVCDGAGNCSHPNNTVTCSNEFFCDGIETCLDGVCEPGIDPCPDDGIYCNGTEDCDEDVCIHIDDPCPGQLCDEEGADICMENCTDVDNDNYAIEGGDCGDIDCDDNDPEVNPGLVEICSNAKDDDCDGIPDNCLDLIAKSLKPIYTDNPPTEAELVIENVSSETLNGVEIDLIANVCGQEVPDPVASETRDLPPGETIITFTFDLTDLPFFTEYFLRIN